MGYIPFINQQHGFSADVFGVHGAVLKYVGISHRLDVPGDITHKL